VVFDDVLISIFINCIQVIWHFVWNHVYFIVMNGEHIDKLSLHIYCEKIYNLLIKKTNS
jgi:hypothetical protein